MNAISEVDYPLLLASAKRAVADFESVQLGAAISEFEEAARSAVEALEAPCRVLLFPNSVRISADMIAILQFCEQHWTRANYVANAAELHREQMAGNPEMAAFLRSSRFLTHLVELCAANEQTAAGRDAVRASYVAAVASQLVGTNALEPMASILSQEAPKLADRIRSCAARHAEYIATELARVEAEREAAEAAIRERERQRREEVAQFFERRGGRFMIKDRVLSAIGIAHIARGQGTREEERGEFVTFTIDELEASMREAQAMSAAALS